MAYIQPNSTIEFFADINLSPTSDNSLYFPSTAAKDAYFTNIQKVATVSNCTYARHTRGYIRVEVPMSTMIGCTYMRFKNTSFENKWFYAYVIKVEYVNNKTTAVAFAIDPLMTWMGDFHLNQCFVERQHTLNDGIGNNIAEEGLSVGEYVVEDRQSLTMMDSGDVSSSKIVIAYIPSSEEVDGDVVSDIYTPVSVLICDGAFDADNALNTLLEMYKIDNVVNMYMIPSDYLSGSETEGYRRGEKVRIKSVSKPYSSLNGYVPRNKKLFCYPYKYMVVDNMEGNSAEYKYEYFNTLPDQTSSGNCEFVLSSYVGATAEAMCYPQNYKGALYLPQERISKTHFPSVSFAINSYEAYLAQKNAYFAHDLTQANVNGIINGTMAGLGLGQLSGASTPSVAQQPVDLGGMGSFNPSMALPGPVGASTVAVASGGGLAGLAGLGVMAIGGGALGGIAGMAKVIGNNLVDNIIKPSSPMQSRGNQSCDVLYSTASGRHFEVAKMCITKNYAMMLDSYFDMFGYAVKQHAVPNMNARPNWTYVKTIGCSVGGNLPADDAAAIEAIFDNGIRFWKNHTNIGNYSLNNAPA